MKMKNYSNPSQKEGNYQILLEFKVKSREGGDFL